MLDYFLQCKWILYCFVHLNSKMTSLTALDIRVPYQDPNNQGWMNLCWASIVAALVSYYSRRKHGVLDVLQSLLTKANY